MERGSRVATPVGERPRDARTALIVGTKFRSGFRRHQDFALGQTALNRYPLADFLPFIESPHSEPGALPRVFLLAACFICRDCFIGRNRLRRFPRACGDSGGRLRRFSRARLERCHPRHRLFDGLKLPAAISAAWFLVAKSRPVDYEGVFAHSLFPPLRVSPSSFTQRASNDGVAHIGHVPVRVADNHHIGRIHAHHLLELIRGHGRTAVKPLVLIAAQVA
jgi:hypothetical protein